jgi:hypothetical protein
MPIPQFNHLTEAETQLLLDAPSIITVLIGSADGDMDSKEIEAGLKMIIVRKESGDALLQPYYNEVDKNYDKKLFNYSNQYKDTPAEDIIASLSDKLRGLNEILSKIDPLFASVLVKSLRAFAKEIAEASGGFAGLMSISNVEQQLIDLPMITI